MKSLAHPDSEKWYSKDFIDFSWSIASDITGVNILGDQEAETNPGIVSRADVDGDENVDVQDIQVIINIILGD